MIIKRGPFLLLTAALAQQACASDDDDSATSNDNTTTSSGGTSDGGSSASEGGSGGTSDGGSSASEGGSGGTTAGAAGETDAGGAAGEQGSSGGNAGQAGESGDTGGTSATGGTGGTSGGTGGTGGSTCDDSVGAPGNCEETGCTDFSLDYCNVAVANLKPAVAETAVDCFAASDTCSSTDAYECVRDALAGACPDPYQDVFCADAVNTCTSDAITEQECHMMVDGLNDYGIAQIYSCVEAGCQFGLWSCVESLD